MQYCFESPYQLKGCQLKNRLAVAPMTRTSANADGTVTRQMKEYYTEYAKGGFALIITEGTYTDESYSQGYTNQPGIANHQQADAWHDIVAAVHENGALMFCQLMHAGALTQGNRFCHDTIAPSAIQPVGEQLTMYGGEGLYPMPREITRDEMRLVRESFAQSARRAMEAGFDGLELHGANGYLLDEFLTEYTNVRTDEYGGGAHNRIRYLCEIIGSVREAVGGDFPVGIRISQGKVNDGHHVWPHGNEDAPIIFSELARAGADFIHITEYDAHLPAFQQGSTLAELAKTHSDLPIIANGQLENPLKADKILSHGADIVALGKGALANMDWPLRVQNNEALFSFDPAMLSPRATLSSSAEWRRKARVGSVEHDF